ncbi:c-type cytochrome [Neisseria sp. Ec49-e6-T10]|uniref:c-type cytochrome n=1 Tax=Neisseria sp. Ec49-e6-T10 TaxID=3140744 RepID=UPI003EBCB1C0
MKRFSLATLALALASMAAFAAPPKTTDLNNGKTLAENVCVACHAADGNSVLTIYPSLAGQHAVYAYTQALAIKNGQRTTGASAAMVPMVENLSEQDLWDASAYFSRQHIKQGEADPKGNLQLGLKIYRGGKADIKLPSCASCHGPSGAGMPDIFPRISSQHADYVVTQLEAFRAGERVHPMMDPIASRLTDEEIKAVANYIQGLR